MLYCCNGFMEGHKVGIKSMGQVRGGESRVHHRWERRGQVAKVATACNEDQFDDKSKPGLWATALQSVPWAW